MELNKISLKTIIWAIVVLAFFVVMNKACRCEYNEDIRHIMGNEVYHIIKDKIGEGCTDDAIVEEYTTKQWYYDSLKHDL